MEDRDYINNDQNGAVDKDSTDAPQLVNRENDTPTSSQSPDDDSQDKQLLGLDDGKSAQDSDRDYSQQQKTPDSDDNALIQQKIDDEKTKKERFVFSENDIVSADEREKNDRLFVEPGTFVGDYGALEENAWIILAGKKRSGKRAYALKLASELLQKRRNIKNIYRAELLPENTFDVEVLLSLKDSVVIFPNILKANFKVASHLNKYYPNKRTAKDKLSTRLRDNNCWLIMTIESDDPKDEAPLRNWARSLGNWQFLQLPNLKQVFSKRTEELNRLYKGDNYREPCIEFLTSVLRKDYISFEEANEEFAKDDKKLIHLSSVAEVVDFIETSFLDILESVYFTKETLEISDLERLLEEKASAFCSQKEETKTWFNELELEEKCLTLTVTLFDNCSWPIFWGLYGKVREALFPKVYRDSNNEQNQDDEQHQDDRSFSKLKPLQAFYRDDISWLERIRACIKEDPYTGAHIVDFVKSEFRQEMLYLLLNYHRYELSTIAFALVEEATEGPYALRWVIARALGRIGELDFVILLSPVIKRWIKDNDFRKLTVVYLYQSILKDSTNQFYHKKALRYIEKELIEGNVDSQWTAIVLCREIGKWDEVYLEIALRLLHNIIAQQWKFSLDEMLGLNNVSVIKERMNKALNLSFIMYTLQDLASHHTPIPIIEHIEMWLREENRKINMFAALIAFIDEESGIPWQYCDKRLLNRNFSYRKADTYILKDEFLKLICEQSAYRDKICEVIVLILEFIERNSSGSWQTFFVDKVLNLIFVWLREALYIPEVYDTVQVIILGILNRQGPQSITGTRLRIELKKWQGEKFEFDNDIKNEL